MPGKEGTSRKSKRKRSIQKKAATRFAQTPQEVSTDVFANAIDSPPIDGFTPWIAINLTDARTYDMSSAAVAPVKSTGTYIASNPQLDYAIGILDSGASTHVIGYHNANRMGVFGFSPDLLTSNIVEISGVIGSVFAYVSNPLGVFVDGLAAIEPNGLLTDTSTMTGEYHVSIALGENPGSSTDLITAIGSPLSVYHTTHIRNDLQMTVIRDSNVFTAPDLTFYDHNDPCLPTYSNIIPLELRPLGSANVQYISFEMDENLEFIPFAPSVIVGNASQSLFFVHSVDLYDGNYMAYDRDRFMLDTGAQVTVIGSRVAARLTLDIDSNDFGVEIEDVTGATVTYPGFYIDTLEVPALGQWFRVTNVPVILLDISSPEGGTLDGIIGMNLFGDFNLVLKGGGLFLQDDPYLSYEPIDYRAVADIAPSEGDGVINWLDVRALNQNWLVAPNSPSWNPRYDISPHPIRDGAANMRDFAEMANYWRETTTP